jgi:acetyltransferase-like isoleucine patch superfamily enzyme
MMIELIEEYPGSNEINIHPDLITRGDGTIRINGRRNRINIAQPHVVNQFFLLVTGDNVVDLGFEITYGPYQHYNLVAPGELHIGPATALSSQIMMNIHEPATIRIGKHCLFSGDISVACSPVHKIIDLGTMARINPAADITIEDHVWINPRAVIYGGAHIGHDSVVGFSSMVNKAFPPNCVLAGAPAKVIRENVTWEH